jgi:hypothetical protein
MRNKDQILLEEIYSRKVLKENTESMSYMEERALRELHKEFIQIMKRYSNDDPTVRIEKGDGKEIVDVSKLNGEKLDLFLLYVYRNPDIILNATNSRPIPYSIREDAWYIKNTISDFIINDAGYTGIKCPKEAYDELATDHWPDEAKYLEAIQGDKLNVNISTDSVDMAVNKNKNVNPLTIMNQILYPIKDMDQNHFNGVYENILKNMAIQDDEKDPSIKHVYLNTKNTRNSLAELKKYFGTENGYFVFSSYLHILFQMIVNEYKDDENLNGDYSPLLTLGAFVY